MAEATVTGTERIAAAFAAARDEGRAALMPYLMGGFPDAETSLGVAESYVEAGADLIELGVPFSDPLADGPVIHSAATRALAGGATLDGVLSICERVSGRVPVLPMVYANMALARGPGEFARLLAGAGAAGAIVPDLPLEEAGEIGEQLSGAGIALVPLVAPTTPDGRRRRICERAEGFVYVVSDTRVTGERDELPDGIARLVAEVRAHASVPAAVGFGIGTPEQAAAVGQIADGVIVGTRLVRAVDEAGGGELAAEAVGGFIRAAREAMSDSGRRVG
ncbi:MAG: tryptophan synthase subunit alpha [Actinobacteria bacterium 13_1_20CM_3_68_9]|nr:MAG: tryptophan synthase subunit alpha [Actinobacteria bacterium 13_1_20CM_3_68_9]